MRYRLNKMFVYRRYGNLKFIFAKAFNPEDEFFELNEVADLAACYIWMHDTVSKEEIMEYVIAESGSEENREEAEEAFDFFFEKKVIVEV